MGYIIAAGAAILIILFTMVWNIYLRTTDLYRFSKARGPELINYLEWVFCRKGYVINDIKYVSDYEAEVIISKNSVVTMVQIRCRKGKTTKTMVEFLYNVALKEDCDWAIIVSISGFTKEARIAARELGITLHDRRWLRTALKGCRLNFLHNKRPAV